MRRSVALVALIALSGLGMAEEPKKEPGLFDRLKAAGLSDKPFTMVVKFQIKAEEIAKFEAEAAKCVAATVKEKGCRMYECNADREVKGTYYFLEKWDNAAAIEAHLKEAHTQALLGLAGQVSVAPPTISFVTPVGK
jgi:quinol monooxygenase YgiN